LEAWFKGGHHLKKHSFYLFSAIRLMMFILLSCCFYTVVNDGWRIGFITTALILFIVMHFIQFTTENRTIQIVCNAVDFILSSGFGFFFPNVLGLIYLIFFGVIATTVFVKFESKVILRNFTIAFFIVWIAVSITKYKLYGEFSLISNTLNFMYIFYGAIVGRLIQTLASARTTIASQYDQLNTSHAQLQAYAQQVEELTVIRERNEIAREIHDAVGHKMTAMLVQMQLANEMATEKESNVKKILDTCEQLARESLQEVRLSVRTLKEDARMPIAFFPMLKDMLEKFGYMTGLETNLHIAGDASVIPANVQPTIKRIVQESLTNTQRHSNATRCEVRVSISETSIQICMQDNGTGIKPVVPGFGLINMRERVLEHGGSVHFQSNTGEGFLIEVTFPLTGLSWRSAEVSI